MNRLTRREVMLTLAGTGLVYRFSRATDALRRTSLGIVTYALGIHEKYHWAGRHAGLPPVLAFLEECHLLGAGGIQCPVTSDAVELRRRADRYDMHVEAILDPPRDTADVARFERDVKTAGEAGANVGRTTMIPGRRYERFKTLDEFREFEARGLKSLMLAEPILARHRFRLAVENHKDQQIAEKLDTLRRVSSEWIGLCVDVANNFALLEDPLEAVRAFAPFAFTVHIKDMVLQQYADGWLIADVALGEGILPLEEMMRILRTAKPDVKFNLETITRDPIQLPVRKDSFWATLPGERAARIARAQAIANARSGVRFPGEVSTLPVEMQLDMERRHVEGSLAYARDRLGLVL
jgi:3-oxoisoapionate decarboxylase